MTEPVDLVYLWCDMADPVWNRKRAETLARFGKSVDLKSNADCRGIAHDELRFSLRSASRAAPWIRRVYVIVDDDNRPPDWLASDGDRLRIVRMSEMMPAEYLPCYCSDTIEHFLHRIPDLTERFLYANDDMMFYRALTPEFFFTPEGKTVCRFGKRRTSVKGTEHYTTYHACIENSEELVRRTFGLSADFAKAFRRAPHHNIDAYLKSAMTECFDRFRGEFEASGAFAKPFRTYENYQRLLYTYYELATGRGVFRRAGFNSGVSFMALRRLLPAWADSLHFIRSGWQDGLSQLRRLNPGLFCFNDTVQTTEADRAWLHGVYETLFPEPCAFER